MQKLSRSSSGARHARWAREVLATVKAHHDTNYLLAAEQRSALSAEIGKVEPRLAALESAVAPYRNFLEHAHVDTRAKQRVANYLCDEAQRAADGGLRPHRREIDAILPGGHATIFAKLPLSRVLRVGHEKTVALAEGAASKIRSLPAKIPGTAALADGLDKAAGLLRSFNDQAYELEAQRAPLKAAVQKAVFELREELDQMDGRLRSHFSEAFIDSLYPELSKRGTTVADEDDEDDDTSAAPEGQG